MEAKQQPPEKILEALTQVAELLEQYAPSWYPDSLRKKINIALGKEQEQGHDAA